MAVLDAIMAASNAARVDSGGSETFKLAVSQLRRDAVGRTGLLLPLRQALPRSFRARSGRFEMKALLELLVQQGSKPASQQL